MSTGPTSSNESLTVLHIFRRYNTILTVFRAENFHGHDCHIIGRNVFRVIAACILYVALFLVFALNLYSCFDPNLNWTNRAFKLGIVIIMLQQILVVLLLTLQNRRIYATFDHIQRMIESRKILVFFQFRYNFSISTLFELELFCPFARNEIFASILRGARSKACQIHSLSVPSMFYGSIDYVFSSGTSATVLYDLRSSGSEYMDTSAWLSVSETNEKNTNSVHSIVIFG